VLGVLLVSSLLTAAYLGPILYKAYFEESADIVHQYIREIPWLVIPLVLTAVASFLLGVHPDPILKLARSVSP
jgi:multicomponent Na+:H+ antiporter subunit D